MDKILIRKLKETFISKGYIPEAAERYAKDIIGIIPYECMTDLGLLEQELKDIANAVDVLRAAIFPDEVCENLDEIT